jgi:hypothetical protein
MYIFIYVYMNIYIHVCMYVYMNLHMYIHIYICKEYDVDPAIETYEKGRIYTYMYFCMYMYV